MNFSKKMMLFSLGLLMQVDICAIAKKPKQNQA